MKLNILFIFLFLLFSCGEDICEKSDFTTTQGICVITNGFDVKKDYIEYSIDVAEMETSQRFPKKYKKKEIIKEYSDTSISIIESFSNPNKTGETVWTYGPFINDYFEIKAVFHECNVYYTISHEMLHVFRTTVIGDKKPYHPKTWFMDEDYTPEENLSTLEYAIFSRLWHELSCN